MLQFLQRIIHDLIAVHPPHPLFVHFPIALVSAALFFILLALWRRNDILETIAFANISLASVSTIFALGFGIRDDLVRYGGQAANHNVKIILASILLVLTAVTAIARWRNPQLFHQGGRTLYVLSYFVSFLIVAVLGFLGGVIIYGF
jgi:uncharacterized membrane protein